MGWIRNYFRRRIRRRPFPDHWRAILAEHAPFAARIPHQRRSKFETDLMIFEEEKHFEGAGGFEITEEVRVVISAAAVRLILFLDIGVLDDISEIIIYPGAYRHPNRDGAVLGEVNHASNVVLSWEDTVAGLRNPADGLDTATHEFAHVLDLESGAFNGTPTLRAHEDYAVWGRVMSEHYLAMRDSGRRANSVLRDYAATNEAEFFAVATEVFFEKPASLKRRAPEIYAELSRFYGFDPDAVRRAQKDIDR